MGAILLKNSIPGAFSSRVHRRYRRGRRLEAGGGGNEGSATTATTEEEEQEEEEEERLEELERDHVRSTLPSLLFDDHHRRIDIANDDYDDDYHDDDPAFLHLSLALAEIASSDFPARWPTLLEDLAGVASGGGGPGGVVGVVVPRLR
jgi:hypothetical protein